MIVAGVRLKAELYCIGPSPRLQGNELGLLMDGSDS